MLDTAQPYVSLPDIHVPQRQIQSRQLKQSNAPLIPIGDLDLNTSSSGFGFNVSQLRKSLDAKITLDYQPVVRRSAPAKDTRTKDTTTNRPGTTRTMEARASSEPRGTVLPVRFFKSPSVE
ncbi:MAG: hypothetical protein IH991_15920 [Planctomycetes bacterium]|nr:hypothetical protein [Planctomycetota bacterium]